MTHAQIYKAVNRVITTDLMDRYGHLSYAEMAEIQELSEWADLLRWAHQEWEKVDVTEAIFG